MLKLWGSGGLEMSGICGTRAPNGHTARTGMPWDDYEDAQLRALVHAGKTKREIGEILGRSSCAVENRAKRLHTPLLRIPRVDAWTAEADQRLADLIASGFGRATCAYKLHRGRRAIEQRAVTLGLRFADVAWRAYHDPAYVDWTDERVELAERLWKSGMSGAKIAERLGGAATKMSVIGKMHRRGLTRRRKAELSERRRPPRKVAKQAKPGRFVLPPFSMRGALGPSRAPTHLTTPATDVARVSHQDLEPRHCRWPVGEPDPTVYRHLPFYCGARREVGFPYCHAHCLRAFSMIPRKKYGALFASAPLKVGKEGTE